MDICKIAGATRVLGKPADWDESQGECLGLPIVDHDGWMVSEWKPSAVEIGYLIDGGSINLWIQGTQHPVAAVSVGFAPAGEIVEDRYVQLEGENRLLRMSMQRLKDTLESQARMCDIALAATGAQ